MAKQKCCGSGNGAKKIRVGRLGKVFFCELFLYTHIKFPQVAELASAGMEAYMYNSIL